MNNHEEVLLDNKADEMLNEEVAQKEILSFLEMKYGVNYLVSQRTIQRWIEQLNIECIKPIPRRNSDRRYYKQDILYLEKKKRVNLLRKRNIELKRDQINKVGIEFTKIALKDSQKYYQRQAELTSEERMQQDFDESLDYSISAKKHIKEEMLDMVFKEIFPKVSFDKDMLAELLRIVNNPDMFSDEEVGKANIKLEEKAYIKNYRE